MKEIVNKVMVCTLALVFLSISNVFAVDLTKLENKEFKIKGFAKNYDADGYYNGSGQISQGMLRFYSPETGAYAVHNIAADLQLSDNAYPELNCATSLGPYTLLVDKIRSTECSMECYDQQWNLAWSFGPEACVAKIVFSSGRDFTGTITLPFIPYTGDPGSYVLTLDGTFVGKYPLMAPD